MLQHLNVLLVVRNPNLNAVLEVRPHQCRVQGHDHLPTPAGHTVPDTLALAWFVAGLGLREMILLHLEQWAMNKNLADECRLWLRGLGSKVLLAQGGGVCCQQRLWSGDLGALEPWEAILFLETNPWDHEDWGGFGPEFRQKETKYLMFPAMTVLISCVVLCF